MSKDDLDLLPLDRLAPWLDAQDIGSGAPIERLAQLGGGSSNAVFRFHRGDADYVLRRPPRHPRRDSNKSIVREGTLLRALAHTDVPHPMLHALCDNTDVIGVCFYVMKPIDGWSPGSPLKEPFASSPRFRREMGFALVDALAALALVDYRSVGLEDFGRPDGFLERQVPRWRAQLESYREITGYQGHKLPGLDRVATWLEANRPRDYRPGILHGDPQLPNAMFAHDRPELIALIDWELSTLGDPMLDLGWILASWSEPDGPRMPTTYIEPWNGFPSRAEMIDRYLARTDRTPEAVRYFCVLACYKLGIILEGHVARAAAGIGDPSTSEIMARLSMGLLEEANDLIDGKIFA
ncbi:MAG TPA: phosphotransferase family protein [Deltaproteobacteria bacterium]|nr:phosphotransferase family protein [Candidatus Binatota bacterium]HIL14077.1 phosphotransferase family protein [Deltaproteobacteria bacterium]